MLILWFTSWLQAPPILEKKSLALYVLYSIFQGGVTCSYKILIGKSKQRIHFNYMKFNKPSLIYVDDYNY